MRYLLGPRSWYSHEYQDNIKSSATTPYGNTHTDSLFAQRVIGQKQYELTDHLGNVLATVSDQRTANGFSPYSGPLTTDSPANILAYSAITEDACDYYPFGQLMPGRYRNDSNMQTLVTTGFRYTGYLDYRWIYFNDTCTLCSLDTVAGNYHALYTDTSVITTRDTGSVNFNYLLPYGGFQYLPEHVTISIKKMDQPCADSLLYYVAIHPTSYAPGATGAVFDTIHADSPGLYTYNFVPQFFDGPDWRINITVSPTISPLSTCVSKLEIDKILVPFDTFGVIPIISHVSSNDNYHYGYNGKYKDNEWAGVGNHYDYGFRQYDPRIARFNSVDPINTQYPNLTPYQFASNRPIDGFDLDGLEYVTFDIYYDARNHKTVKIEGTCDYELKKKGSRGPGIQYNYIPVIPGTIGLFQLNGTSKFVRNYYGIYYGPDNPKLPIIGGDITDVRDNYTAPPIDELDAAAQLHDAMFDNTTPPITGGSGSFDPKSSPANVLLISVTKSIMNRFWGGNGVDIVTGQRITPNEASMAKWALAFFTLAERVKQSSDPNYHQPTKKEVDKEKEKAKTYIADKKKQGQVQYKGGGDATVANNFKFTKKEIKYLKSLPKRSKRSDGGTESNRK